MKIINAQFSVRLGKNEHDMDAATVLAKLLEQVGFDGPVNITTIPDTDVSGGTDDVIYIDFEPDTGTE